ncbi:MAG TPA: fibronectin type III domain-containing protein [Candidatus Sulfotelmatobacter sp.]|nr:fibronectin type III domain-containing protein [Candidatus Sulfotelmatobacter sp.]
MSLEVTAGARGWRWSSAAGVVLMLLALKARAEAPAAANSTPAPAPASGLEWKDVPNDAGHAVELDWKPSPDEAHPGVVATYVLERGPAPGGPWSVVDSTTEGSTTKVDPTLDRGVSYFYRVITVGPGGRTPALSVTGPVVATSQWFNTTRWSVLVLMFLFFAFVLWYIWSAQSGKKPFVRRIPGIDAIEEAIGRATEMGRPVLYVPGIQDIDEIQTVQGLIILESVAKMTARYQTPITVPVAYPIPFTIAEEMVRSGYLHAGRPEQYDPNSVRFVSPEQFAYVAALTGIMLRDKPAAHIFMGSFYAESLLLAETGFSTGAIQVAGTANVHQLPFFVVACDYTLIGEELYAASAYLSGEPRLVGGLKGADLMKVLIILMVLIGSLLETLNIHGFTQWMATQ